MNITNKDFEAIEKAVLLLPAGEAFSRLNKETQQIIIDADVVLTKLIHKKKEQNRKTAEYIAERRKTDKNYARPRKEN